MTYEMYSSFVITSPWLVGTILVLTAFVIFVTGLLMSNGILEDVVVPLVVTVICILVSILFTTHYYPEGTIKEFCVRKDYADRTMYVKGLAYTVQDSPVCLETRQYIATNNEWHILK